MFLDLGEQPWCNNFVTKDKLDTVKKYPLRACFCEDCTTVQIDYTVPKEEMYLNHTYLSGTTSTMQRHFESAARTAMSVSGNTGLIVDIGSNDGTLLETFRGSNRTLLGVEPCQQVGEIAISKGINTLTRFFDYECADDIVAKYGRATIISAANVFYHVENIHEITRGVKHLLDKQGVFVVHGSYLPKVMERKAFDIIYHEHLLYYRIQTLQNLLSMYDLEVFDVYFSDVHGGSFVAFATHAGERNVSMSVHDIYKNERDSGFDLFEKYAEFGENVEMLRGSIKQVLSDLYRCSIYAYGSPAKGTVMLNYCGIDSSIIPLAVEKNQLKFGKYVPCVNIPIVDEQSVTPPDYYFLLSWNFINEIIKNNKSKFILPIPTPIITC